MIQTLNILKGLACFDDRNMIHFIVIVKLKKGPERFW